MENITSTGIKAINANILGSTRNWAEFINKTPDAMIEIKDIEKSFDGVKVLKGVSAVFETGKTQGLNWARRKTDISD